MSRSLAKLRRKPNKQTKAIKKDELIDSILSAEDVDVGSVAHLEEKLATIATELGEIKRSIASSETATHKMIMEMEQTIDKQANIIMQQQLFLEDIDRKNRETNLVVLEVPDDQIALNGANSDESKLGKI